MLSKNKAKLIRALHTRKGRKGEGLFVAEGPKLVEELLATLQPYYVAATEDWFQTLGRETAGKCLRAQAGTEVITANELAKASLLQTPQDVIALFPIPVHDNSLADSAESELCLALDGVQDPGNMGTIVRLADWFGIHDVFCSTTTADVYNPKAVQATMGALSRVRVHYINLAETLASLPATVPVFGTSLDGAVLWETPLSANGVLVMGNEGNGLSPEVRALCTRQLLIPRYPHEAQGVESLNVAMATGIVLSEFRRRQSFTSMV